MNEWIKEFAPATVANVVRALIFWDLRLVNLAIWLLRENLSPLVCLADISYARKGDEGRLPGGGLNTAVIAAMNVLQTLQQRGFTENKPVWNLCYTKIAPFRQRIRE